MLSNSQNVSQLQQKQVERSLLLDREKQAHKNTERASDKRLGHMNEVKTDEKTDPP